LSASIVRTLDRVFYRGYLPGWDAAVCRELILSLIQKQHTVLDVGAGAGIYDYTRFRGRVAQLCGIDPDPRVLDNIHLDEARLGAADAIPYPDGTFDLAFAWNVVEHLATPEDVFREVARVMKPGGVFVIKTPNIWHYVALASRMLPHSLHDLIISRIFRKTSADIFPTHYRCNSERRIRRLASATGFRVREVRFLEPRPEYLRFSPFSYLFGIAYERIVNSTRAFRQFRAVLIAVLEKRG
jgi:SAM-dependent methyltransferase